MDYSTDTFIPLLSETLRSLCSQQFPSHVDYMIGLLPSKLAEINTYSIRYDKHFLILKFIKR